MERTVKKGLSDNDQRMVDAFLRQFGATKVETGKVTIDWTQEEFPVKKGEDKPTKRHRMYRSNGGAKAPLNAALKQQHMKTSALRAKREG